MKHTNYYLHDMLDFDLPKNESDVIWQACNSTNAYSEEGCVFFTIPFKAQKIDQSREILPDNDKPLKNYTLCVSAYGDSIIRVKCDFGGRIPDEEAVLLQLHETVKPEPLDVKKNESTENIFIY